MVKAGNGEVYIVAEALVEKVMKVGGVENYEVVETYPGSFFSARAVSSWGHQYTGFKPL